MFRTETSMNGMWVRLSLVLSQEASTAAGPWSRDMSMYRHGGAEAGRAPAQLGFWAPQKLCKNPTWERDGRQPSKHQQVRAKFLRIWEETKGETHSWYPSSQKENEGPKHKADKHVIPLSVEALGS